MSDNELADPMDPKQVYDDLIERCLNAKAWHIRCLVDEAWVGRNIPFKMMIQDGVYHFWIISTNRSEAIVKLVENVPVLKFIDEDEDEK